MRKVYRQTDRQTDRRTDASRLHKLILWNELIKMGHWALPREIPLSNKNLRPVTGFGVIQADIKNDFLDISIPCDAIFPLALAG